jgi:hypothetical protein
VGNIVLFFEPPLCRGVLSTALTLFLLLFLLTFRKDLKKVTKLEAQIPYHEGRGNKAELEKIKEQIASVWAKAKAAQEAM